ncbi:MAG: DinB family protein [Bacteroidetes bacterium]|nr:DinB family protein [Bacteroidota bacterium]
MKTLIFTISLFALAAFTLVDSGLTKEEREAAIAEMNSSHDHLLITLRGLSETQINYKSDAESWSIAECVEHITISEITFAEMVQGLLQTPADPAKRSEIKITDKELIAMIVDRSNKVKTQKPFEPTGKFGSHKATLETFEAKRSANIEFVKNTVDDLRNRVQQFPFGTVDAYQIILFMAAHTERHVRQIEEIMTSENFPKK